MYKDVLPGTALQGHFQFRSCLCGGRGAVSTPLPLYSLSSHLPCQCQAPEQVLIESFQLQAHAFQRSGSSRVPFLGWSCCPQVESCNMQCLAPADGIKEQEG